MIIAIDGPAAAGKGTLARRLAEEFDLAYLDTGLLYRATARNVLHQGGDPGLCADAVRGAENVEPATLDDAGLRAEEIGRAASQVAEFPQVRQVLLDFQRHFAEHPPAGRAGVVIDGRDIGTVVCPDATVKIFVTASLEARAARRAAELGLRGEEELARIKSELVARDQRDSSRATSPLRPASDAHLLDTTNLDIDSAFVAGKALVERAIPVK